MSRCASGSKALLTPGALMLRKCDANVTLKQFNVNQYIIQLEYSRISAAWCDQDFY